MYAPDWLLEWRSSWLPNIPTSALLRLQELLEKDSPLLVSGCFTRAIPMGCLASQIAWHHPRTAHLTVDAGITWLHEIARLNPATSYVLQEWDHRGPHDLYLRTTLLKEIARELQARQQFQDEHRLSCAASPD
jgi:hypothetical protein